MDKNRNLSSINKLTSDYITNKLLIEKTYFKQFPLSQSIITNLNSCLELKNPRKDSEIKIVQSVFKGFASTEFIVFEKYFIRTIEIVRY